MTTRPIDVCAAGHICLDIIPFIGSREITPDTLYRPGNLVQVGQATLSLGGSVANTGMALHRLGAKVQALGKVGDDVLGHLVIDMLRKYSDSFPKQMLMAVDEGTSYSIVLSLPDHDRCFLHFPGANETFSASDLSSKVWHETRILHFGYPPLMPAVFADNGRGLGSVFSEAQRAGALTSLDMAMPGSDLSVLPNDWRSWLLEVLPTVDLFLPSLDELLLMWEPCYYSHLLSVASGKNLATSVPMEQLSRIAGELIEIGTPLVLIKLGDRGLYLRTQSKVSDTLGSRSAWRDFNWQAWNDIELVVPCWNVPVVGANGAGDCTIAGFLMSLLHGRGPEDALKYATAAGACCVQSVDALSNIPSWESLLLLAERGHLKLNECYEFAD